MKKLILLSLLFLWGCASNDDMFQGRSHMSVRKETSFKGLSMADIEKKLGKPLIQRIEEPNYLWTYRRENCTTLIYFSENKKVSYAETRGICSQLNKKN